MTSLLRPMPPRDPHQHHRAATSLELLFDLVIVIAIATLTASFHHAISEGHALEKLPAFGFMFLALWWIWMNFTWFASAFDNDDALYRLLVLIVMLGALIFSGGIGHIFETLDFSLGLYGWIIMRLAMVALWLRAAYHAPQLRVTLIRYAIGITIAQILWIVFDRTTVAGSGSFFLFGAVVFLVEFLVPLLAEQTGSTPWHRHHMIERYGCLTIIVIGEVLLSIAQTFGALFEGRLEPELVVIALSGLVMVFAYWWIYFAERQHLTSEDRSRAFIWGYGHLFIFAPIAMLGAGLAALFDVATHHSEADAMLAGWFIGAPMALALTTLWAVRDRYMDLGARAAALPVGAVATLVATVMGASVPVFAAITVATLIWRVPFTKTEGLEP